MAWIGTLLCLALMACRSSPSAPGAQSSISERSHQNVIPLVLTFSDGIVDSQLVPAHTATADGYLALDTGSSRTFLYDANERGGTVAIGSESFAVIGRDLEREWFRGKPILGVLGTDLLLEFPSELDYPGRRIVRHLQGSPSATQGYAVQAFVDAASHLAVRVTVDSEAKLLLLDTGSRHTLLIGAGPHEGDQRSEACGVDGKPFAIYEGSAELIFAGERRQVPVLRAPSFPYFEGYAHELHAEMAGLLGLTSLGFRRIVIDPATHTLHLGPLQAVPAESSAPQAHSLRPNTAHQITPMNRRVVEIAPDRETCCVSRGP